MRRTVRSRDRRDVRPIATASLAVTISLDVLVPTTPPRDLLR